MPDTSRLALPRIDAAQSQKHVTHNEALALLDACVQLSVIGAGLASPPASPVEGARYIVGAAATGAFAGREREIACFDDGAWRFLAPRAGWRAYVESESMIFVFDDGAWISLLDKITALQNLRLAGIGTTADANNPLSAKLNAALFTARETGQGGTGDLRFKLNRQQAGGVVSQLYQSNYSGRAETGLIGDELYRIKVSPDGNAWKTALSVDPASGRVAFDNGLTDLAPPEMLTAGAPSAFVLTRGDVAPLPDRAWFWMTPHAPNATAALSAEPTLKLAGADAAPLPLRDADGRPLAQGAMEAGRAVLVRKAAGAYRVETRRVAGSFVNLLEDGGRFSGSPEPPGAAVTAFAAPSYLSPANGATISLHSTALLNSSSLGGAGPAMNAMALSLVQKIRAGASLLKGVEFHIALVTAGAGTSGAATVQGVAHHPVFSLARAAGPGVTLAHYMRVLTGVVVIAADDSCPRVLVDGVLHDHQADAPSRLFTAANGWAHVQRWAANPDGVATGWPLRAAPGTTLLFALPAVVQGLETLPWNSGPIPSRTIWS
jgi:hypothetical protein